jgi:hypothetical protein
MQCLGYGGWFPGQNLKWAPPRYKPEALSLGQIACRGVSSIHQHRGQSNTYCEDSVKVCDVDWCIFLVS